jgi:hypothetical protein
MEIEAAAREAMAQFAYLDDDAEKAIAAFGLACYRAGVGDIRTFAAHKAYMVKPRGTTGIENWVVSWPELHDEIHRLTEEGGVGR